MAELATGTECRIRYRWRGEGPGPGVGDFLVTPAGSAYQVLEVRPGETRSNLRVVRLGRGAVELGEPGVFPLVWDSRRGGRRRGRQAAAA